MPIILESIDEKNSSKVYTNRERQLIHELRTMLKDLPSDTYRSLNSLVEDQKGERWNDMQLLIYINQAVADLNGEPPHTSFSLETFPDQYKACIMTGAMYFSLFAEAVTQQGESFSYSDNGLSLNINLAQGYQSMAQMLLSSYTQMKKDIKKAMRPGAAGIKSAPSPVKIRSYSPRMWSYR